MKKRVLVITILFIITVCILLLFYKKEEHKYYNEGLLYINEVMTSNKYTIKDNLGNYSDYIELYNGYDYDIDLSGYYLSDKDDYNERWKFPSITIKKESYLLIYASLDDTCSNDICHTNFKLKKSGGVVSLSNSDGKILSKIKYDDTYSDTSYGFNGSEYVYYYVGTPGVANDKEFSNIPIIKEESDKDIVISEYTNNNSSLIHDMDDEYVSVLELYNNEDKDINLGGFYISDTISNPTKYKLPNVVIKSKSYLVIFASGKDKYENGEIHTNFTLTSEDTALILSSDKGEIVDNIRVNELDSNMVASLYNNTFLYSYKHTFGGENSSTGSIEILNEVIKNKEIVITEVSTTMIELKNISDKVINLEGYGITGNNSNVMKFPNINVNPNSYLVLYESDEYSYENGKISTGFKIGNEGEKINLYNNKNMLIDTFTSGKMNDSVSYGINNKGERVIYKNPTLGYENSSKYYSGYSEVVSFSNQGGYVNEGTEVELISDNVIYYTTDGSYPDTSSIKYTKPINIDKTTTIKAISYREGYIESDAISRTYFVGRKHDMAIVSISTDDYLLFSDSSGLLSANNYRRDWEKAISFEFYENDGTFGVMFNAGTNLVGQDSRDFAQKSMAIHLRSDYGQTEVTYPFFTDHDVTTFSSFTLRNSGEDVVFLKFKDAFLIEVLKGQMDIDFQYYRPVVVYLNGEYYGIYNIREKINEDYVYYNHGIDKDNVDIIKGDVDVRSGSIDDYNALLDYVSTHDMRIKENYEYVKTQVDIDELINYWIAQTYYRNVDSGNIRCYKEQGDGGKWRWVLFDLDWSMWPTTYQAPALYHIFEPYGHGAGNYFSTALTYNLYKNSEFKDAYLKAFAYHMKNTFNPDRMLKIFDEVKSLYETEMPYHVDRWYDDFMEVNGSALTMGQWDNNIASMKSVITNRYKIVKNNLKSQFRLTDEEYNYYFGDL